MPGIGKTPQNQLDALPLITPDVAANPGEITITGQKVTAFWSGTTLGVLQTVGTNGPDGNLLFITPQLDLRGFASFLAICTRRVIIGAGDVANSLTAYALIGNNAGVFQDGTDLVAPFLSTIIALGAVTFPVYGGAFPQSRVFSFQWYADAPSASGSARFNTTIGTTVKIAFKSNGAANANRDYTIELWGIQ